MRESTLSVRWSSDCCFGSGSFFVGIGSFGIDGTTGCFLFGLVGRFGFFGAFLTGKVVESVDESDEMSSMISSSSKGSNGAGGCSYVASGGGSMILGSCVGGSVGF